VPRTLVLDAVHMGARALARNIRRGGSENVYKTVAENGRAEGASDTVAIGGSPLSRVSAAPNPRSA